MNTVATSASFQVDLVQSGDIPGWDAYAAAHLDGTIYHTLAWRSVTEEGLGHAPYYLVARGATGTVRGILPLFLVTGLFGRRLVSVPMRDRAGLLADEPDIASLLLEHAATLTRELRCSYLELRSLAGLDPDLERDHHLHCERQWITTRIDLAPGKDLLWKALDRDAIRWAINRARKHEVLVESDDTPSGADQFYELFARTRRGMGIPPFPRELFRAIHRHIISQGKGNLFFVKKDNTALNGLISFFSRDAFVPAYAAPQNAYRKLYPSEVIFWHTIEWAAEHGFRTYDFGADSPRQTGLLWFKKKWGGVQQSMHYHFLLNGRATPPNFDSSSPVYNLARRVWSNLPLPMSKRLGTWVTRQLS